jgi:uncharacterized protein (DUF1778 family)
MNNPEPTPQTPLQFKRSPTGEWVAENVSHQFVIRGGVMAQDALRYSLQAFPLDPQKRRDKEGYLKSVYTFFTFSTQDAMSAAQTWAKNHSPSPEPDQTQTQTSLTASLTPQDCRTLEDAARLAGLTLEDYICKSALATARTELFFLQQEADEQGIALDTLINQTLNQRARQRARLQSAREEPSQK